MIKRTFVSLCVLILSANLLANKTAQIMPVEEKQVAVNSFDFVPGFDSTGEKTIALSMLFINGCYSWSKGEVSHVDSFTHVVKAYANVRPGMCLAVMVPAIKPMSLGKLEKGVHTVKVDNGDTTYLEKTITINE